MDIIAEFLQEEIYPDGMYSEMMKFILSFHLRSGEFEGNRFIVKTDCLREFVFAASGYASGKH